MVVFLKAAIFFIELLHYRF